MENFPNLPPNEEIDFPGNEARYKDPLWGIATSTFQPRIFFSIRLFPVKDALASAQRERKEEGPKELSLKRFIEAFIL